MLNKQVLKFQFQGYWHAGTGISSGNELDAQVQKDRYGCPVLNGRHIKGLLRQSVRLLESWGQLSAPPSIPNGDISTSWEKVIFGSESQKIDRDSTRSGLLLVSDACLPEVERSAIANSKWQTRLYRTLNSTAINDQGVAEDYSLRAIEVAVPVTLYAEVELLESILDAEPLWQVLTKSLSLIRHAGGYRNRGFGEVGISLEPLSVMEDSK